MHATHTINLGILAHVDAGKTSLTERLLYEAGAISAPGRVDDGTTRTDSMDIERRRGITVRTNVASFAVGDVQINLIDTPGHSDFIAEVERSLSVLDAAVLVVSAVEGVQSQTVVLWRALRRLAVPTLIFINKIDRGGADPDRVLAEIDRRLTAPGGVHTLPLTDALAPGTAKAGTRPVPLTDTRAIDVLALLDDRVLRAALAESADAEPAVNRDRDRPADRELPVSPTLALRSARAQVRRCLLIPVAAGSALTGAGVPDLLATLPTLLPWARESGCALSGVVYKIEHAERGRLAHCRLFGGELRVRDRAAAGEGRPGTITALERSTPEGWSPTGSATAGDVVRVRGLASATVGAWVGQAIPGRVTRQFPRPALESVVDPVDPAHRGRLFAALQELAEADPLINLRLDDERHEIAVSLYGEVQKEVIAALLAEQFGVAVTFRPTVTVHLERIVGTGAAHAISSERSTPYLATLGFRVEPAAVGSGLTYDLAVELGSMPPAFFAATWEGVRTALAQGLSGWEIPDARVVLTHTGYWPRQSAMHQKFNKNVSSVGADFRHLAPVLMHEALRQAQTVVCEPVETFELEIPVSALPVVTVTLARLSGLVTGTEADPTATALTLTGTIPTRNVQPLLAQLPEQTSGEAVFTSEVTHYTPVTGPPP
ncbi:MAG TPA: translation factor GTPase family protein, partial [Trebonia sp.]|nr:translation factor GTPase family protein [Trebonia sp.]